MRDDDILRQISLLEQFPDFSLDILDHPLIVPEIETVLDDGCIGQFELDSEIIEFPRIYVCQPTKKKGNEP